MSGTTSVPAPSFGASGFIAPNESSILVGVLADMNAAFGGDLVIADASGNPELRTPQGQLASSITAIIGDANDQFLAMANGVDPALATGRMQDGIGRIYFLTRKAALSTVVAVTCSGLAGTVIPAGVQLGATDDNIYIAQQAGTIGAGGTVSISFACSLPGPIAAPVGSVSIMRQLIPGWDSATNPADGIIGQYVESAAQFEARRAASVAANALGTLPAVLGAVLSVAGVLDAYVTDNVTGSSTTLDGVTVPAHALYVCVAGGTDAAVAMAIWTKKSPGCGYASGNTTVTVTDPSSNYAPGSAPTYPVTFERAIAETLVMAVQIANSSTVPANAAALVQAAVLSAFAGGDGGPRARIGQTVYALRYVPPIADLGAWARVISVTVGASTAPDASFTGAISGATLTVSSVTGTIATGATVIGAGVPDGVTIVSGAGTSWTLSTSLGSAISAEPMVSVKPTQASVAVGVAHIPVLTASNIAVSVV